MINDCLPRGDEMRYRLGILCRHHRACPGDPRLGSVQEERRGWPQAQASVRSLRKADYYVRP